MSLFDVGIAPTITSPTISEMSMSSFDMVSSVELSQSFQNVYDSDDEIVWSVSRGSALSGSELSGPVDDFVILSRPHSSLAGPDRTGLSTPVEDEVLNTIPTPGAITRSLVSEMQKLTISEKSPKIAKEVKNPSTPPTTPKKQKKRGQTAKSYPSPAPSPIKGTSLVSVPRVQPTASVRVAPSPKANKKKLKKKQKAAAAATSPPTSASLGSHPTVDDISDRKSPSGGDASAAEPPTEWQEATAFISSFLLNPAAQASTVCRLTLMQSIIIELGLAASSSLPVSLTAAKAFLKSRAFLNIREYLAVRGQGPKAVQSLLYPSRGALIKDIRKKKNAASLKWVKDHGLQVLLVGWMR